MKIGATTVLTPGDDPLAFELDWRMRLARAIVSARASGRFSLTRCDDDVRQAVRYLEHRASHPVNLPEAPHDRVLVWSTTMTGAMIEALLLTVLAFEEIGLRLNLAASDVRLYSRLMCDTRDDGGRARPEILARVKLELQGAAATPGIQLKRMALHGGAELLDQMVGTTGQPVDLLRLVDNELTRRVVTNELTSGDLIRLQATGLLRRRLEHELAPPQGEADGWAFTRKLLSGLRIQVTGATKTPEQQAAQTQAIQEHFEAQQRVSRTPVTENPNQDDRELDTMLKRHLGPQPR
ncbi:MAG: hypothetical protein K8T26_11140 [Lentisphaerae bacterium]|nr:hypothetical protein [Lentisphaerota bacterium]